MCTSVYTEERDAPCFPAQEHVPFTTCCAALSAAIGPVEEGPRLLGRRSDVWWTLCRGPALSQRRGWGPQHRCSRYPSQPTSLLEGEGEGPRCPDRPETLDRIA